jgi:Bacteriocin-protection, YdeI or OmpD-Associated/Domain of unknown function (DUF1905)
VSPIRFLTTLSLENKNATGIHVPASAVEALGGGGRPAVVATVNGYTYRATIMGYDPADPLMPFSAGHRAASGLKAGDPIEVELVLDTAPREVEVPEDLAAALAADPVAKAFFDGLSNSNKRVHTLAVEGAKTPETRARRVDKAIALLHEHRVR